MQVKRIDELNAGMASLSARTQATSKTMHPTTLAAASALKNHSRETYAQLQQDLAKLQDIEDKLTRAAVFQNIAQTVSAAMLQDRESPQGRPIPALGAATEWLSTLHRLTDSGRVKGCVAILELLIQLLAFEPGTYLEIAAGGPQVCHTTVYCICVRMCVHLLYVCMHVCMVC